MTYNEISSMKVKDVIGAKVKFKDDESVLVIEGEIDMINDEGAVIISTEKKTYSRFFEDMEFVEK